MTNNKSKHYNICIAFLSYCVHNPTVDWGYSPGPSAETAASWYGSPCWRHAPAPPPPSVVQGVVVRYKWRGEYQLRCVERYHAEGGRDFLIVQVGGPAGSLRNRRPRNQLQAPGPTPHRPTTPLLLLLLLLQAYDVGEDGSDAAAAVPRAIEPYNVSSRSPLAEERDWAAHGAGEVAALADCLRRHRTHLQLEQVRGR